MNKRFSFTGTVEEFSGPGAWVYIPVPEKYTNALKEQRRAWGSYPIQATVGDTTWDTKLMTKKGGDFFVALKAAVRAKENIHVGDTLTILVRVL